MHVECAATMRGVGMWIYTRDRSPWCQRAWADRLTSWRQAGLRPPDTSLSNGPGLSRNFSALVSCLLSLSLSTSSPCLPLLSRLPAVSFFTRLPCSRPAVLSRSPTWEDFTVKRSFVSWLTRLALRANGIKILLSESCRFCPSHAARLLAAEILIVRHGALYLIDRRLIRSWRVTVRDMPA